MIAAISRKKGTHTGFTNDNKTITKTTTFGIKNIQKWSVWDSAFFSLFLSLPLLFLFLLPSLFPVLFPVLFPFLFRFLFRSFSFRFPFLFLSLSFSFRFPFPFLFLSLSFPFLYYSFSFSLSSPMWILWSRGEASAWKNDKRKKKKGNVWKNHLKGLGGFTRPHLGIDTVVHWSVPTCFESHPQKKKIAS